MSQNGKRKASFEELQEPSSKRQRFGEPGHAITGTNTTGRANIIEQPAITNAIVPYNIIGQPTTTTYGNIAGQAATRGHVNNTHSPRDQTVGNAAGVGGTVDGDEGARAAPQTGSTGPKRKRGASSPLPEEPSSKQSARGQKRAGFHEAGLNDKERGTVKDREGHLYCLHPVDNRWVPAVFHSAIRADLIAAASARGSYSVGRARGALENDVTSYHEPQRDWSGERQHWPRIRHNVLNRHERNGWRDDYYRQRAQVWIHTDGRMVIDHDRNPMYIHPDLPDTLSSAVEGWYLEAVMRLDSRILRETIRARLPDVRRPPKSKKADSERMYALTAISNKRLRFRHDEGLVAWDSRAVSTEMNDYFRSFIPQASLDRNSNEGGRTLVKAEREHGENLGKGKSDKKKRDTLSSSPTRIPDQRTTASPLPGSQEPAQRQQTHSAYGGSMLTRVNILTSPSPLVQANGQFFNPYHQAGQAVDPSPLSSLPEGGSNPYQMHNLEPVPSVYSQGDAVQHTASMGPPPPTYSDGTSLTGFASSAPYYNVQDQFIGQSQRIPVPQHLERPMNGAGTSVSNRTLGQTNGRTARAGGSRRGRARWRNDDPPNPYGAVMTSTGGNSAGGHSNNLGYSSQSNGAHGHAITTPTPTITSNGERGGCLGRLADNLGLGSHDGYITGAGVSPDSTSPTGNQRDEGSVQQSCHQAQELLGNDVNHPQVEDGQDSHLDESPFVLDDGWPTALDLELLGFVDAGNTNIDPNSSGNGLEPTRNDANGSGSTRRVCYDNSAPLQDGQQNTVWRLDDNGTWVLDETPGETNRYQAVNASNNTANRQPPANSNDNFLAPSRASPQLHNTSEIATGLGDTLATSTPTAPRLTQPSPTPTPDTVHHTTMLGNDRIQQVASCHNASSSRSNTTSMARTADAQPAEEIDPHNAVPTNNFQYATIQTLLEPTRRDFISAFQDEEWRSYVPRDFVPPTDRSLSLLGVLGQLSVDFWEIWTSRFGEDAEVPPLALPSDIDEFSAAVLLGSPYQ
ncbi:MAG: hypothetical protein OHK93_005949 [Ramalina farinacea]|uniref:Uncharacterized protein n=1 Tax=Ramalina farinacea TaxID=258253 RepID=A0AA43TT22_9LECA|nr:hypothetical protein [Ramalina farinacea]